MSCGSRLVRARENVLTLNLASYERPQRIRAVIAVWRQKAAAVGR
jgi:hypothetical protein